MSLLVVIPARYGSSRFPGKPLATLHGKPMVWHTWQRTVAANLPDATVVIATDDERIASVARDFGATVAMTREDHPSGTDRAWEVAQAYPDATAILNVQGDEPFIDPQQLHQAVAILADTPKADIVTLACRIPAAEREATLANPNVVKAVMATSGRCLYFSRAGVPFCRDGWEQHPASVESPLVRHVGLYLYRRHALQLMTQLPPSPLEQIEKLEQLRALEADLTLYAAIVDHAPEGVDTPDDLARLEALAPVAQV
jgi:3-deoxy-manno-octulosonate cytidylyltransferase (CMP-KDO synthetase)